MTENTRTTDTVGERHDASERRAAVRDRYSRIATESSGCDDSNSCCDTAPETSQNLGYSADDLDAVGGRANLGLGCGNPTAIASLEKGDTVLDLGSGGGFDCFLAAREVGTTGRVIGVDMTPEMVETARENIETNDATNVEFRLGEIEHLPVADESVDVVLSNCVINLSPDKPQVFREAHRVLRPGGRLAISDLVRTTERPPDHQPDPRSLAACNGGEASMPALEALLTDAGFTAVTIKPNADSDEFIRDGDTEGDVGEAVVPATIEGKKPASEAHA